MPNVLSENSNFERIIWLDPCFPVTEFKLPSEKIFFVYNYIELTKNGDNERTRDVLARFGASYVRTSFMQLNCLFPFLLGCNAALGFIAVLIRESLYWQNILLYPFHD